MIKRVLGILSLCSLWLVSAAGVALAQEGSSLSPEPTSSVSGTGGSNGTGGTAFTGSDTSGLIIAIAALVAVGIVALYVTRRRASHSA